MNPDGSFNQVLYEDYAERAAHEMAMRTKALVLAYYGKPPQYSYWNGCSKGGQQGLMEAQRHPDDFDGVLAGAPAISVDRLNIDDLWPQIVMQQDLGGPMAAAKLKAATAAANAACNTALTGVDDGYISDPSACRYDPSVDASLLCVADGGSNTTASCLTLTEAKAINKMWYGPTADGNAPSPATDNGWHGGAALAANQIWYGVSRGTDLAGQPLFDGLAGALNSFPVAIASDHIALALLDPSYATPAFVNATGTGSNQWKTISYAGNVSVPAVFEESHQRFQNFYTDNPDLSAFRAGGKKLLMWHGTHDSLIFPQGSINYYERVAAGVGGYSQAQEFARFYLAPGIDHCTTSGVSINPPTPGGQVEPVLMGVLQAWVETGEAPDQIAATSVAAVTPKRTRPWCLYPQKLKYVSGDVNTGNFTCE
jgi:feruloyl esterase